MTTHFLYNSWKRSLKGKADGMRKRERTMQVKYRQIELAQIDDLC